MSFSMKKKDGARKMTAYEIKDENMRHDIRRTSQLFEGVVKRLEEVSLLKDYGQMKIRVLSEPGPGWQVAPIMSRILGLGVTLGFFAGCGFAFVIELADKRFRSPGGNHRNVGAAGRRPHSIHSGRKS